MKYLMPVIVLFMGGTITTLGFMMNNDNLSIPVMGIGFNAAIISAMWLDLKGGK